MFTRSGLRAALGQLTVDGWKPIAFTSRFQNCFKEQSCVNELELLGAVWSVEYFKNYMNGNHFTIITDHRALLSILKENNSNKSYNSCLTPWIGRLFPFQFDIEHMSGAEMRLVDYISRNPNQKAKKLSAEEFIVAKLNLISASVNSLNQQFSQPASHLHTLIQTHDLAPQIRPKNEPPSQSINLISTLATRSQKHEFFYPPRRNNQI